MLYNDAIMHHCSTCVSYTSQGCKIRQLPQILTIALLRFLYDYEKGERYKVRN